MVVSVLLDIEENPSGFVPFFSTPVLLVITVDVDENVLVVVRAVLLAVVLSLSNELILSVVVESYGVLFDSWIAVGTCVSSAEE